MVTETPAFETECCEKDEVAPHSQDLERDGIRSSFDRLSSLEKDIATQVSECQQKIRALEEERTLLELSVKNLESATQVSEWQQKIRALDTTSDTTGLSSELQSLMTRMQEVLTEKDDMVYKL